MIFKYTSTLPPKMTKRLESNLSKDVVIEIYDLTSESDSEPYLTGIIRGTYCFHEATDPCHDPNTYEQCELQLLTLIKKWYHDFA